MKKNKKLPLWSRLRNDHTQPYYPQLQSPHSLDSRRILTIHLLQNHLSKPPAHNLSLILLSSAPRSTSPLPPSSLFFLVAEEELRGFPLLRRARKGRKGACLSGFEPRPCWCRAETTTTGLSPYWDGVDCFRDPSTTNGRASPAFFFFFFFFFLEFFKRPLEGSSRSTSWRKSIGRKIF